MRHLLAQRAHVSFYFICHSADHSGSYRVAGVLAKERNQLVLLHLHERQFLRHAGKDCEPHLQARSYVSAEVFPFLTHVIVGNGGAGVYDQQVLVRTKALGTYCRCQTVLS